MRAAGTIEMPRRSRAVLLRLNEAKPARAEGSSALTGFCFSCCRTERARHVPKAARQSRIPGASQTWMSAPQGHMDVLVPGPGIRDCLAAPPRSSFYANGNEVDPKARA